MKTVDDLVGGEELILEIVAKPDKEKRARTWRDAALDEDIAEKKRKQASQRPEAARLKQLLD